MESVLRTTADIPRLNIFGILLDLDRSQKELRMNATEETRLRSRLSLLSDLGNSGASFTSRMSTSAIFKRVSLKSNDGLVHF